MKDYSKMSDFEINKAVALCLGVDVQEWNGKIFGGVERNIDSVTSVVGVIDYCNNPSDAWPIVCESKIAMRPVSRIRNYNERYESWEAQTHESKKFHSISHEDENPLKAAMVVYLMMKDEEK